MIDQRFEAHREILAMKDMIGRIQGGAGEGGLEPEFLIDSLPSELAEAIRAHGLDGPAARSMVLPPEVAADVARVVLEVAAEGSLRPARDGSVAVAMADRQMNVIDPTTLGVVMGGLVLVATIEFDVKVGSFRISKKALSDATIGKLFDAVKAMAVAHGKIKG